MPTLHRYFEMLHGTILNMTKVEDPDTYLGISAVWGKYKREALGYVKEMVITKFQGLKHQLLSQAGCEVLINAIALAVLSYSMIMFSENLL